MSAPKLPGLHKTAAAAGPGADPLAALLGEEADADDVRREARKLWEMLDQMAGKDPEAYRKFVQGKAKEAEVFKREEKERRRREETFRPEAAFCVASSVTSDPGCRGRLGPLYLNVCASDRVPEPSGSTVPLSVGPFRAGPDAAYGLVDVVVHTFAAARCGSDAAFREVVLQLALSYVERDHQVSVSREGLRPHAEAYVGGRPALQLTELGMRRAREREAKAEALVGGVPRAEDIKLRDEGGGGAEGSGESAGDASDGEAPLVVDLAGGKPEPEHQIRERRDGSGLVVTVRLPGVRSVSEVGVDLSERRLVVGTEDVELDAPLPRAVCVDQARAKFSRAKAELKIAVPFK